jgi:hypothetical protein
VINRSAFALLFVCLAALMPASGAAPPSAAPRVAIDDEPAGAALRVLDQAGTLPFPVAVRIAAPALPADAAFDGRLATLAARQARVWLSLPAPDVEADFERWQSALRSLLARHGPALTILEVTVNRQPARVAAFAMQVAATEARASHDAIRVALGGAAMSDRQKREEIYRSEIAPYVDLLVVPEGGEDTIATWLHAIDPTAASLTSDAAAHTGSATRVVDGCARAWYRRRHAWVACRRRDARGVARAGRRPICSWTISRFSMQAVGLTLESAPTLRRHCGARVLSTATPSQPT